MVTTNGWQDGALEFAEAHGIALFLLREQGVRVSLTMVPLNFDSVTIHWMNSGMKCME